MGSESGECLMGTDVQLSKVKNLGDGWWWELHNNMNVFIATELYSQIWLKYYGLYYVIIFTTIENTQKKIHTPMLIGTLNMDTM